MEIALVSVAIVLAVGLVAYLFYLYPTDGVKREATIGLREDSRALATTISEDRGVISCPPVSS